MGYLKKIITLSLLLVILSAGYGIAQGPDSREVVILFTHDLHSYFLPYRVLTEDGQQNKKGGWAKIAYLIKEQKIYHGNKVLCVDAGDFSMGTLFHTSFLTETSELLLLGEMGYDVMTFGNHDFDFRTEGLGKMLQGAKTKSKLLPLIVASNIVLDSKSPEGMVLQKAINEYPVAQYQVVERNKIRIGLFGIIGRDAADDTPFAKSVKFVDPIRASKDVVDILLNKEKVDLIVCLSHSGTLRVKADEKIKKESEDEFLAQEVPQIDVIISGHTHTLLPQPLKIGKTVIVSCGCYGEYLGILRIYTAKGKPVRVASYELKKISTGIPDDRIIAEEVDKYKDIVNKKFLSSYRLSFDQVIAESDFDMESIISAYQKPREMGLGNLITDAYRYAAQKAEGPKYKHIHMTLEALGLIRDSFLRGRITTADAFRVLSLGIGNDGTAGYPLLTFYVNGKELKDILEVETSVAPLKKIGAHLQVSGVKYTFNPYRVPFDRVTQISVQNEKGEYEPLESNKLYRLCSNLYAAGMITYISKVTHGLIDIKPRDEKGNVLSDLKQALIYIDENSDSRHELKQWIALVQYLRSFPDINKNGIPDIPERYRAPEGRYVSQPSMNLKDIFGNANMITYGVFIGGFIVLCVFIFLLWLTAVKIRKYVKK